MGGTGSGRKAAGKTDRLTLEEKIQRNRDRARERWQRLNKQKETESELKGQSLYKLHYRERYHTDEERLGYLREDGKRFKVHEDPNEWMKYIREKNRQRLDDILNDPQAMERIFSDRDDISLLQKVAQRQKKYMSEKEIREKLKELEEEFGLVEDRRPSQSTYKRTEEETIE
jgi:hypothetical protein